MSSRIFDSRYKVLNPFEDKDKGGLLVAICEDIRTKELVVVKAGTGYNKSKEIDLEIKNNSFLNA
jgi:hypothetical protein